MASTSETGHPINVANFETIVPMSPLMVQVTTLKSKSEITSLEHSFSCCKSAVNAVSAAEPAHKLATDARDAAFKLLSPLITKVINALKATDTTAQVDETAQP